MKAFINSYEHKKIMCKYEYIEHTGDMKIRSTGKNFKEALENSMQGLIDILNKNENENKTNKQELILEINADYINDFVIMSLEKILVLCEIEDIIPEKVKIVEFDDSDKFYMKFALFGKKGVINYNLIKAITYHQFKAEKIKDDFVIEVLIDI